MNETKRLVAAAVVGLLAGVAACAATPPSPAASAVGSIAEKNGCGSHEGGACGSPDSTPYESRPEGGASSPKTR